MCNLRLTTLRRCKPIRLGWQSPCSASTSEPKPDEPGFPFARCRPSTAVTTYRCAAAGAGRLSAVSREPSELAVELSVLPSAALLLSTAASEGPHFAPPLAGAPPPSDGNSSCFQGAAALVDGCLIHKQRQVFLDVTCRPENLGTGFLGGGGATCAAEGFGCRAGWVTGTGIGAGCGSRPFLSNAWQRRCASFFVSSKRNLPSSE